MVTVAEVPLTVHTGSGVEPAVPELGLNEQPDAVKFPLPVWVVPVIRIVLSELADDALAMTVQLLVIGPVVKVVDTKLPLQPDAVNPV